MNAPDAARSVVSFESSAFNCTEPKQYFINEGCFGDDVAAWFRDELRSRGYAASEPGQEDFGWYLLVEIDGLDYFLLIGYREGTSSERGAWFVVLERHRKWPPLGIASNRGIKLPAAQAVHGALSTSPAISNVRWHARADFEKGRENRGTPAPT
jgi:hypothetical protein